MPPGQFNPQSSDAMFATILERVDEVRVGQADMRKDFADTQARVIDRLERHDAEIATLKTSDAVRARQTKWAVAFIGVVGWGINAFISWQQHV